ncbi:MmgE/PrpD family protein [Brachybacterium phenoliresistens]|uniref:MmgE/PrpD family protein n=1 Tax=Brachybacterium phenoliresistens TaxID=396014 RepID=UPI0004B0A7F0|nr:MmgE/PrpD family protein [Brachybacterium phenoliresistens]
MPDALARAVVAADPLGDRAATAAGRAAGAGPRESDVRSPAAPPQAPALRSPAASPQAPALRAAAARAIADVIAASFAVAADPSARADRDRLVAWALAEGAAADPRVVIGAGTGLAPARAALVGGFQAHLLDLDDTHELVRGHPSAVLVPTLLALARPEDGIEAMLAAYIVGLEVMARLGRALGPAHYQAGWHPTGTAGAVAAAAAGAHLRRLDEQAASTALSVAASRSGGVRAQFGTPGKPLHAGLAAQTGVESVAWAAAGLHTAEDAVLGPAGLLAAHGVPEAERRAVLDGFGAPVARWALLDPGVWFKRYPFCSAAMSAADAAAETAARLPDHLSGPAGAAAGAAEPAGAAAGAADLAGSRPVDPEGSAASRAAAIAEVVVRMRPGADAALIHTAPRTGEEARFSVEAILALILLGLAPDLTHLSPRPLPPVVTDLAARVRREHVPAPRSPEVAADADGSAQNCHSVCRNEPTDGMQSDNSVSVPGRGTAPVGRRDFWAQVEVRLRSGEVLRAEVQRPLGSPDRPLPDEAVRDKLVASLGDARRAAEILDLLGPTPTASGTGLDPASAGAAGSASADDGDPASAPSIGQLARLLYESPDPYDSPDPNDPA